MESKAYSLLNKTNGMYPVLFIPKALSSLETNCDDSNDFFIELTISTFDIEGNDIHMYSGFCNIQLVENWTERQDQNSDTSKDEIPLTYTEPSYFPADIQSQVWIDPARSPYVYNRCEDSGPQEQYSEYNENHSNPTKHITVEQHNTYITQNIFNWGDTTQYSALDDFGQRRFRRSQPETSNNLVDPNYYGNDEFECGVFLSKLPEEIWNQKETKIREEMKYVGLQSDNEALRQLMSSDIQSISKQQKTILFLGHDSHYGQTIQKIAVNSPSVDCTMAGTSASFEQELRNRTRYTGTTYPEQSESTWPPPKKYQCAKCKQIFDQIVEFRHHIREHVIDRESQERAAVPQRDSVPTPQGRAPAPAPQARTPRSPPEQMSWTCLQCGKNLKSQEKFERHCLGHGDPELECPECGKVYASKFTQRAHRKIHARKRRSTWYTGSRRRPQRPIYEDISSDDASRETYIIEYNDSTTSSAKSPTWATLTRTGEQATTSESRMKELCEPDATPPEFGEQATLKDSCETYATLHPLAKRVTTPPEFGEKAKTLQELGVPERIRVTRAGPELRDPKAMPELRKLMTLEELRVPESLQKLGGREVTMPESGVQRSRVLRSSRWPEPPLPESERALAVKANAVIAKVMSNNMFLMPSKRKRRGNGYPNRCSVCHKLFSRVSDLKRHLIEHVIRSTLDKRPINRHGILNMCCEVCRAVTFTRIDKYKAHLREHANLTLYRCTFCDKSFSDSSNFSKHKKIHMSSYFQCDLCRRKFNSKKMIAQHMEQHKNTLPVECNHCGQKFHFRSMLNKHVKLSHGGRGFKIYRCGFCSMALKSLKDKWDHEWKVHRFRKNIVDCAFCNAKFRKVNDLKRHCNDMHSSFVPSVRLC